MADIQVGLCDCRMCKAGFDHCCPDCNDDCNCGTCGDGCKHKCDTGEEIDGEK